MSLLKKKKNILKINQLLLKAICLLISLIFVFCTGNIKEIRQVKIAWIETMPNFPESYKMLDWTEKTYNLDRILFNFKIQGDCKPYIWIDDNQRNLKQKCFGLYNSICNPLQGNKKFNGEFHEATNTISAVLSAGLVGINKTKENELNYVKMLQSYFNNEWGIIRNHTTERMDKIINDSLNLWSDDVFSNILFYAVADIFNDVDDADYLLREVSNKICVVSKLLKNNYYFDNFNYSNMSGHERPEKLNKDIAAGHSYILYCAYKKFGDKKYLEASKIALATLYDIKPNAGNGDLLAFGALVAARMNVEEQMNYDVQRLIVESFCGTGKNDLKHGVLTGRWGTYEVNGLKTVTNEKELMASLKSTFNMAWPLVALVNYAPEYSRTIAKWLLNASSSARVFYPYEIEDLNQSSAQYKHITKNEIAYSSLLENFSDKQQQITPYAINFDHNHSNEKALFSISSSTPVGIFGSIIHKTNVEGIIRINTEATNFYSKDTNNTYLYFNPHNEDKEVEYNYSGKSKVDLYDILQDEYVIKNLQNDSKIKITANDVRLIVEKPAGSV
jgi:hypothetical protein